MKTWARVASLQFMKYMNIFFKNVFWTTVCQWKNSDDDDDDDVREKQPYLLQRVTVRITWIHILEKCFAMHTLLLVNEG